SLEVHYLASPEGELYFALLSDWTDAPSENAAGDAALLDIAVAGIERLNRLHGTGAAGDRFLLLHRRRVWSDGQKRWMGWERKRGCPRGIRRSAAAGCAVAAGPSRGVAVSARLFEREWHRSVLSRSVRRIPGSVQ